MFLLKLIFLLRPIVTGLMAVMFILEGTHQKASFRRKVACLGLGALFLILSVRSLIVLVLS